MARHLLTGRYLVDTFMDNDDNIENNYEELSLAQIEGKSHTNQSLRGGSRDYIVGYRIVYRDLIQVHERLCGNYLANPPKYGVCLFCRRFRIKRTFFM